MSRPAALTGLDRHDGSWWACFANYDAKGGEPGRGLSLDHAGP